MRNVLIFILQILAVQTFAQSRAFVTYKINSVNMPELNVGGLLDCRGEESSCEKISIRQNTNHIVFGLSSTYPFEQESKDPITITSESLDVTFQVSYRYYKWGCNGSDETLHKTASVKDNASITVSNNTAKSEPRFVSFKNQGILMNPDWNLTYEITSISPFQPNIISDNSNKCSSNAFDIIANPNTPSAYTALNSSNTFEWKYGEMQTLVNTNPQFDALLQEVSARLLYQAQSMSPYDIRFPDDINLICTFIENGNYDFFKNYLSDTDKTVEQFANNIMKWTLNYSDLYPDDENMPFFSSKDLAFINYCLHDIVYSVYKSYGTDYYPYIVTEKIDWHTHPNTTSTLSFLGDTCLPPSSKTETVYFQVRAKRPSDNAIGPWSTIATRSIKPSPPVIDLSRLTISPTCPNAGNGSITLGSITSLAPNIYTYRIGASDTCMLANIEDPSSCGWTSLPEEFSGTSLTISSLDSGSWRLYITYKDANIRNCFTEGVNVVTFKIDTLPDLRFNRLKTDITCPGGSDGKIEIAVTSGTGSYSIWMDDDTTKSDKATFDNLTAGRYYTFIQDNVCKKKDSVEDTINMPTRMAIDSIIVTNPTCFAPENGAITLELKDTAGHTPSIVASKDELSFGAFMVEAWYEAQLPHGSYEIKVFDAQTGCPAHDSITVVLNAPENLQMGAISTTDLKCKGSPIGTVTVTSGSGGSGNLAYSLFRISDEQIMTKYDNLWQKLDEGKYRLTLRNTDSWCTDSVYQIVEIKSPAKLEVSLTGTDIRCFGENNGRIDSTIRGGTRPLTHTVWESLTGEVWMPKPLTIDALKEGTYHLNVTDANGCEAVSNSVSINEPPILTGHAELHDIVCYGEKAHFDVRASGGNGEYIFSCDAGNGFVNFPSDSLFDVGIYTIKVSDKKGCDTVIGKDLTVTAPEKPLTFTYSTKDFNGFQVSCYGNSDGEVDVDAEGGNGASYEGYTYLLNAKEQRNNPTFENLPACDYKLTVSDGRGCKVSKDLQLLQPTSKLTFNPPLITNVVCYYDSTGSVNLSPNGGTAPYKFSVNDGDFGDSSLFENLKVGQYPFTVQDINGCKWKETFAVVNTVPKMDFEETIHPVSCFEGSDGSISVEVSGGSETISYDWSSATADSKPTVTNAERVTTVENLPKGHYSLLATDAAGCIFDTTYEVSQPQAALTLSAYAKPLCANISHGFVRPKANFGTPPYRFALDDLNFMETNEFPASAGMHTVTVQDANGCTTNVTAEVVVHDAMPSVGFMAATLRYAMDTLVLKENCVPKPDSVRWALDTGMFLLEDLGNEFEPVVTSQTSGQYSVKMTGWFRGCDYQLEKTLQFSEYDPQAIASDKSGTGIGSISVSPNPNNGQFRLEVVLQVKQQCLIKVTDIVGKVYFSKQYAPSLKVEDEITIGDAPAGIYLVTAVAENDVKTIRIMISK